MSNHEEHQRSHRAHTGRLRRRGGDAARTRAETEASIVLVRGGCGPGFHRGPFAGCVPNGERVVVEPRIVAPVRLPPPCPRGYVRDPRPGVPLCYPRF